MRSKCSDSTTISAVTQAASDHHALHGVEGCLPTQDGGAAAEPRENLLRERTRAIPRPLTTKVSFDVVYRIHSGRQQERQKPDLNHGTPP